MRLLIVLLLTLLPSVVLSQTEHRTKSPVEILYGSSKSDTSDGNKKSRYPLIAGILNSKVVSESLPNYPQKAKDNNIEGQVEVQLLINEDGDVIFANPLSGREELWAESVKAAVKNRFSPTTVKNEPVKVTGRIIFDFKDGKVTMPYRKKN